MQEFSKPVAFVIPWTHAPVASKLGASPLRQSRHHGAFLLMELHKRARCFAHSRRISSHGIAQTRPMFCSFPARFFVFNHLYCEYFDFFQSFPFQQYVQSLSGSIPTALIMSSRRLKARLVKPIFLQIPCTIAWYLSESGLQ